MLIDIHTHAFPEKIAAMTIKKLQDGIRSQQGEAYDPKVYFNGTVDGLKKLMSESGVDISFVMPIATRTTQFDSIKNYAEKITCGNIISFGTLHPLQDDWEESLEQLKEDGFRGIKLHPEFQSFYIDSTESLRILKKAEELDMWVMLHSGADIGIAPPVHCTPKRLRNALEYVSGKKIIAAHLGAWQMWDEVLSLLAGTDIYMDTAFISKFIDPKLCRSVIDKHGADKILFGSDAPWENPSDTLKFINSLGLGEQELELIKHKNAERILL